MGSKEVQNHGMALDRGYKKVQCNYCLKVVAGFNRLAHHLGGVGTDVLECQEAPPEVKEMFRYKLLQSKIKKLTREVGELPQPTCPRKRSFNSSKEKDMSPSTTSEGSRGKGKQQATCKPELVVEPTLGVSAASKGKKKIFDQPLASLSSFPSVPRAESSRKEEQDSSAVPGSNIISGFIANDLDSKLESHSRKFSSLREADLDSPLMQMKRRIGKFFIENGIDFSALGSFGFQRMLEIVYGDGVTLTRSQIPTVYEIKGWILDQELVEIKKHVEVIKKSWVSTGCTIILDVWCDDAGRSLMNVLVNSLEGTIYLQSTDITTTLQHTIGMEKLLDCVIQEVGPRNVVQLIWNTTSKQVEAAGERLRERYKSLFCTVSITYCMEVMLEAFVQMDFVKSVLQRAKMITKFIYGHSSMFNLMLRHTSERHIVKVSLIKAAIPFLILQNMVSEIGNIIDMFASPDWRNSMLAQTVEGMRIATLVADDSFWADVVTVLGASIPLINALFRVNKDDKPHMGFAYELMNEVKEAIINGLGYDNPMYEPFWNVIDEKHKAFFYSPLHAAGYALNAEKYYGKAFHAFEVYDGLYSTILHMVRDKQTVGRIYEQLRSYFAKSGAFSIASEISLLQAVSPVEWWRLFGGDCPELQNLAVRILSQTCNGGSTYRLKRRLAEKFLSDKINCVEKMILKNLTYAHYNLQLKQNKRGMELDCIHDDIDPLDDWI